MNCRTASGTTSAASFIASAEASGGRSPVGAKAVAHGANDGGRIVNADLPIQRERRCGKQQDRRDEQAKCHEYMVAAYRPAATAT